MAWTPALAVVVLAFFYFLVNFGAAASPEDNTRGLPVAVVNEDAGAEVDGRPVDLGARVVEGATTNEEIGDDVEWTRLGSREEAMRGISRGEYYGALVVPRDYSESVAKLAGPPELPVALVNEDEGATLNGQPVRFGAEAAKGATSNQGLEGVVRWSEVGSEGEAEGGFADGRYVAAIVIPQDYSERLAGLAAPPTPGASPGLPEPARMQLLTNPAVDAATLGTVREVYSGLVSSASEESAARLSDALAKAGIRIPARTAPLLGDPVRQETREARVPGAEAPESGGSTPARIEILTNPSAGPFPSGTVQQILTEIVRGTSGATESRLTDALQAREVQVPPAQAAALGQPVVAEVTDAQPTGENSGRGLMPFYLTFTASILGFIGANALYGGVEGLAGALARRVGRTPSKPASFAAKAVLGVVLALVLGAVEALVAFGVYGVYLEASLLYALFFLALVASVSLFAALVLLEALGARGGVLAGSFLIISLGLATSGGTTPPESLPGFFRWLAGVLPFGHATEGTRALLFYDGLMDAGLGEALWVLAAYLVGALALGGLVSLGRERITRRRKAVPPGEEPTGGRRGTGAREAGG
jgi:uncharacterized phage infection (PIP) family protein YhgE